MRAKVIAESVDFPAAFYSEPQLIRSQWQYPLAYPAIVAWVMKSASLGVRELYIPVAMLADFFLRDATFGAVYLAGSGCVTVGFALVAGADVICADRSVDDATEKQQGRPAG